MQQRENLKNHKDQIEKILGQLSRLLMVPTNQVALDEAVSNSNNQLHEKLGFSVPQFISYTKEETLDYAINNIKSVESMESIADYLIQLGDWKLQDNRREALTYYNQSQTLYELISSQTNAFNFHRSKKEYALLLRIEKAQLND